MRPAVHILVLAAGASTRMRGRDKLLQPIKGKPILRLAQLDPLRVEVVLPQAAYGRVQLGTVVLVSPEGMDDKHKARVTVVDKVIDAASSTFGVRLELTNPQGRLPAGMRCSAEFPGLKPVGALRGK